MANLLAKFRIDFTDMIIIPDVAKKAGDHGKSEFDNLISDFKTVTSKAGDGKYSRVFK